MHLALLAKYTAELPRPFLHLIRRDLPANVHSRFKLLLNNLAYNQDNESVSQYQHWIFAPFGRLRLR